MSMRVGDRVRIKSGRIGSERTFVLESLHVDDEGQTIATMSLHGGLSMVSRNVRGIEAVGSVD